MVKRGLPWVLVCLLSGAWEGHAERGGHDDDDDWGRSCEWTQWGQSASHDGEVCAEGDSDLRMLARLVVDPFADQEIAETGGGLLVHYPAPLLDDDGNVFVLEKSGNYVSCDPPGSGEPFPCGLASSHQQIWNVRAYEWQRGELAARWTFESDWKPLLTPWEPMFQPALHGRYLYVPGAGGTVFKVHKRTGIAVERIDPFGGIDPTTFVSGGITVDRDGTLLYNVMKIDPIDPLFADAQSWLVKVPRHGRIRMVDYATLIPGAPSADDLCYATFDWENPPPPRPWPPPPQADGSPTLPPQFPCLSQRAGVNITPAVGRDGTIFTVTRAHSLAASNYGYLVALRPDLSLKWATSMRDKLDDGCGVLVPYGPNLFDCREGAAEGVDPSSNLPPAGQVSDLGSSSPVALPDGGVLYGAFTGYNGFRGHLMKLDRRGRFTAAFDFGWDVTPGIFRHDDTYSIVVKNNFYFDNGPFIVTQLDADLDVEWHFANTSTETCERQPDGTITCVDTGEHPNGFEWCINAPAIDRNGTVYGLNEDGYMYAIGQGGVELERFFMTRTLAAAYTPLSIDTRGRIYAQNNGELYILGH
jgi:outer membrane protein assembly factor BamB